MPSSRSLVRVAVRSARQLLAISLVGAVSAATGAHVVHASPVGAEAVPLFRFEVGASVVLLPPGHSARVVVEAWFSARALRDGVRFWAQGLPMGVTGRFTPQPLDHQGKAVLTLSSSTEVRAGMYRFAIGAEADGRREIRSVGLRVASGAEITVSPPMNMVESGRTARYVVGFEPAIAALGGGVRWRASGLPDGAKARFTRIARRGQLRVNVAVSTSPSTQPGAYEFAIASGSDPDARVRATLIVAAEATWRTQVVGSTGLANNSIRVGKPRNAGANRLYVGTLQSARVVEFSRTSSGWRRTSTPLQGLTGEIHNLTIGPGRDDGIERIYACQVVGTSGRLWEISWLRGSGRWTSRSIGQQADCKHAEVGDGRNDGVNRVYAARGSEIREYTWDARERRWRGVLVGRLSSGLAHGIVVGRGRGGAVEHVYVASTTTGTHEATFSDGGWTMRRLGDGGDIRNVWVGPGRDDGVLRLYAAIADPASRGIREFTWTGGGWRIQRIASPVGLIHAEVARGRNDGVARLYGAAIDGRAFEFTRGPTGWVRREIARADEYLYGLHFGMVDGRIQVFGASFDTRVYRYSWG